MICGQEDANENRTWHELVGGVNFNEGWLPPDSFETEEEAKRNIKEELSMK